MSSPALLPLIRPAYENQSEIGTAKQAISENSDLAAELQQQLRFDEPIIAKLKKISLSEQQIEQLENSLIENLDPNADPEVFLEGVSAVASILTPASVPGNNPSGGLAAQAKLPENPAQKTPQAANKAGEYKPEEPATSPKETAAEAEEEEEQQPRARPMTILVAVSIGLVATIALVAYIVWDQMNTFRGSDRVAELLDSANNLTGDEFEPVSTSVVNLKDWFFLKSDMRWFAVPKEFADTTTLGCRVFKFDGEDVGQILAKSDQELLLFLFRPSDLGVKMHRGKWEIVEGEHWVGGVTAVDDCCFVVAFKGTRSDMQAYLDKKLKR